MIFLYKYMERYDKKTFLYSGMLPRDSGLEVAYLASPYYPETLKKISDTTFTGH